MFRAMWPTTGPNTITRLTALEPRPKTFLQYVAAGRALARSSGEAHHVVDKAADGILRLAAILNPTADLSARKREHRYVREMLASDAEADKNYIEIVSALTADGAGNAVPSNWRSVWAPRVKAVAEILSGTSADSAEAMAFLSVQAEIRGLHPTLVDGPARQRVSISKAEPEGRDSCRLDTFG